MEKYKTGDVVKTKKGNKAIIVEIGKDHKEALIFDLTEMHPGKIKIADIKEKIDDPNCKVVIEKVDESNSDVEKVCDDFEEKLDRTKDEIIEILKIQNKFLRDFILSVVKK